MTESLPIACTLSDPERRRREREIRTLLRSGAREIVELRDGVRITFPGDAAWLPRIAELMAIERECCRFLRFELVAEAGAGPLRLGISGPEGTAAFLRTWWRDGGGRPPTGSSRASRRSQ